VIALELRSILCVPFRVDERQRGVIYVDHRLREAPSTSARSACCVCSLIRRRWAILQVRRLEEIGP
jgi:hypothetical protein